MYPIITVLLTGLIALGATETFAESSLAVSAQQSGVVSEPVEQKTSNADFMQVTAVEGITEYRLPNGLRVLLAPDDSVPRTTVNITYLVGSRDEGRTEAGMAHLLEHMMFKGTNTLTAATLREEFARRGMSANGTTTADRTNYFATFPFSEGNLDWILRMEADRMVNSRIEAADLRSEMPVVVNEMEIGQTDPHRVLLLALNATAYQWHPYGRATIGTRSDLENASIPLLRAFYKRYYQPDNAVLIVGGTFDPAWVLATIARYFGPIPRPDRTLMTAVTAEPAQEGERTVTLLRVADDRLAGVMYHVPQAAHPDAVAMWLLLQVLSAPSGGRLDKSLVAARKASSVSAEIGATRDPGTVLFLVEVPKAKSLESAREALLEQVENLAERPVTAVELERVRVDARNAIDKVFRNPDALVTQLSEAVAWGDWRLLFLLRDRVDDARVEDLQRVAVRYLRRANRTEGRLIPSEQAQRVEMPPPTDLVQLLAGFRGKPVATPQPQFNPAPENIEAHTQRFMFSNGMKLAMVSRPTRGDLVTGMFILNMGTVDSLKGRAPAAALTAAALTRGAGGRDREQLSDLLAKLKSTVSITAQADRVMVQFETRRDQLAGFLPVLQDILRKPALAPSDLDDVKRASIAEFERIGNAPGTLAAVTMDRHGNPYPPGDPRHTENQRERIAGLEAVRVDDIRDFHRRFYGASHAQLALVGGFDVDSAKDQLEKLFGDWVASEPYAHIDRSFRPISPATLTAPTTDNANAIYLARIPIAVTTNSADYADLAIANRIYGGNALRGRLSERLRQSDGISYSVGSYLQINAVDTAGTFTMRASFAPRNLERVKRAAGEELARFVRDGITAEELADAKSGLLEQGTIARTRDGVLAKDLAEQLSVGQTMAATAEQERHVRAATVASVNAAIRKYIVPKRVINVFSGDLKSGAAKAEPASR